jgi:hypothetical protein
MCDFGDIGSAFTYGNESTKHVYNIVGRLLQGVTVEGCRVWHYIIKEEGKKV